MLLRRQGHYDGSLSSNHIRLQQSGVGGSQDSGMLCVRLPACRKIHSQDSPSDIHGTQPSDTLHQMACCGPQEAIPGLMVLSAPTLRGILGHHQYLHDRDHEPVNTNSYISSVLVE